MTRVSLSTKQEREPVHCKLRTEYEKDNELEKNFENMIFKKKLVPLLLDRHFALAASFQLYGYKVWKEFREASMEIIFYKMMRDKALRHQLRREQLDYKDLWSGSFKALCLSNFEDSSFANSSLKEETFEEGTFDDSSLEESSLEDSSLEESSLYESSFEESSLEDSSLEESSLEESSLEESSLDESSLEKSSLEPSSFEDNSLEEETFSNRTFDSNSFQENSLKDSSFQEDSLADRSFQRPALPTELAQLQRRTSPTELAELERTALHTELAELERPALTTELAPLQTSSFEESSFELSFQKPSFTAQLCLGEATSLGGAQQRTAELQGGVLNSSFSPSHLDQLVHIRVAQASPACPYKGACMHCSLSNS